MIYQHVGPSIKQEKLDDPRDQIDLSSEDEIDILDDSDSDPAWTPSVKTPKVNIISSLFFQLL